MRLLIIEDDPHIAAFLKESLESEFFAVDMAEDGDRGSWHARSSEYDLVVLDNLLPKKSGLEVCKEIRASKKTMPILVVSARAGVGDKVAFLNEGADDYLAKPFALSELLARIRALLRRPQSFRGEELAIAELSLNTRTGDVRLSGRLLSLTRKEFMLLQYLMENEGTILSRGMIMDHVWDMSIDIFSNTIESHILSLRKKLDDRGKNELIQTVSGRGYRMGG